MDTLTVEKEVLEALQCIKFYFRRWSGKRKNILLNFLNKCTNKGITRY